MRDYMVILNGSLLDALEEMINDKVVTLLQSLQLIWNDMRMAYP